MTAIAFRWTLRNPDFKLRRDLGLPEMCAIDSPNADFARRARTKVLYYDLILLDAGLDPHCGIVQIGRLEEHLVIGHTSDGIPKVIPEGSLVIATTANFNMAHVTWIAVVGDLADYCSF